MNQNIKQRSEDQAEGLRSKRFLDGSVMRSKGITRVFSFTSGKGGVGKTHTVTNLGISLASRGASVLILDADLGLANIDVLLGLKPRGNLHDVLKGEARLDDILLKGPEGISIIPAASGVEEIQALHSDHKLFLIEEIERVAHQYDYLLIDTPAGISSDVMYFNSAAAEIVCVINGEPTSLTDTYALIKILSTTYGEKSISVVVNNVATDKEATAAFRKLARAVDQFLRIELRYLGWIPADETARSCIMRQRSVAAEFPSSKVSLALASLARRIDEGEMRGKVKGGMQFFFRQLLEMSPYGEDAAC